jgi:glycerophosphoryl diester phosphodiesterase
MFPENTIPAFEYAIAAGADVLELDLAVTKDNVLVVSHDPVIDEKICRGPRAGVAIHELTLAELRQWECGIAPNPAFPKQQAVRTRIPTFDEVLDLAPRGSFEFNVETKIFAGKPQYTPPPEEFSRLVLEAIRRHKVESRVILQSFDFRTLHAMRKLAPKIRLSALYQAGLRGFVSVAKEAGAEIVSPHYLLVTEGRVKEAHAAGIQVIPWTVNEPEQWERLLQDGVDAIITDDPAALIEYLKKTGRR